MGIQGLLPFLKKVHQPVNVSQFAGCTVAIDAYCWLHKGAFSCAEKLALGEKTDQYVYYCMKYINNLLSKNIKPVMVFDGCHLPSKKNVEKTRREKRELNRKKAAQFLREGKRAEARECLQRCIDISPDMALELMNACRNRGVDCIVAPYEADAQLAYLNKIGVAQVIITEDSDLLLFGCERVLFKMDHAGNGILIEQSKLNEVTEIQSGHYSFDRFRYMCILSGCDYLQSLSGIGLARANKVFKVARQADIEQLLKKLPTYLKSNICVPQEYIDGFITANNTFLYQLVFDPLKRKLVPLNPYPSDVNPEDLSYAGAQIPAKKALHIALGNINIYNGEMFGDFDPDTFVPKYVKKKPEMLHLLSIWDRNYRVKPRAVLHEKQADDSRPNLKGKELQVKTTLRRKSPRKRLREDEEEKNMKSDAELCDMYGSPVKKRGKTANLDDDLHRFIFPSTPNSQDADADVEEEVQPGLKNSPVFFNSLSEAHPEVAGITEDSDVEKENNMTSPRRNVFANKSPMKKPRFNLNATKPKELKSRFFASSKSDSVLTKKKHSIEMNSSPVKQSGQGNLLALYKPIHTNTANVNSISSSDSSLKDELICVENQDIKKEMDETNTPEIICDESVVITEVPSNQVFKFSRNKVDNRKSPKPSPLGRSAFNWSKFKFDRVNSSDSISVNQKSSKHAHNPFKKIVSESNIDAYTKKMNNSAEFEDSVVASHRESEDSLAISSSIESSYPYSIDSDCINDCDLQGSFSESQVSQVLSQKSDCSSITYTCVTDNRKSQKNSALSIYFTTNNCGGSKSIDGCNNHEMTGYEKKEGNERSDVTYEQRNENTDDTNCNEDNKEPVVFLLDSDEDNSIDTSDLHISSRLPKAPSVLKTTNTKASKTQSGCKVSGLSRRSKKAASSQDTDGKQQNLKDMFAKFAHTKSDKPRLNHAMSDSVLDACTPESSSSLLYRKNPVQRTLLT